MIDKAKGAVREVVGTKLGQPGYSLADNGRTNEVYGDLHNPEAECAITAPATPEAAKWTGWATALKPAWEPIVLAMKPMDGTIAHNALTWGVAGMNIDAARIGENPGYKYNADRNGTTFHGKQGERISSRPRRRAASSSNVQGPLAGEPVAGRRRRRPVGCPDRHAHQRQQQRPHETRRRLSRRTSARRVTFR